MYDAAALSTAIAELRCISPTDPAALHELRALALAREGIDELIGQCVSQLMTSPQSRPSWNEVGEALGVSPGTARMRASR